MADLSKYSDEELQQMLSEQEVPQEQSAPESADPPEEGNETLEEAKAFAVSAGQELTYGFGDEIAAGATAVTDTIFGDKEFSDIQETYANNVQTYREEEKRLKERNPFSYNAGTAAGIVGSFWTGGAVAKGAVKGLTKVGLGGALKGSIPLSKISPKLGDITATGVVARSAASGAVYSIGTADDLDADAAENAVIAGLSSAVIGKGFSKVADAVTPQLQKVSKSIANKVLGIRNKTSRQKLKNQILKDGQTPQQWFQEAADDGVFSAGSSVDSVVKKADDAIEGANKEIGSIIDSLPLTKDVSLNSVQNRMYGNIIEPLYKSGSPDSKEAAKRLEKYVKNIGVSKIVETEKGFTREIDPFITLKDLYDIKKDIGNSIKNWDVINDKSFQRHVKNVNQELMSIIDDNIGDLSKVGKVDEKAVEVFQKARHKFGKYHFLSEHVSEEADRRANQSIINFKDSIAVSTLSAAATYAGVTGAPALAIGAAIYTAAKYSRTQTAFSRGMSKLADAVQHGDHALAARLSVASNLGVEKFKEIAASEMSKLELRFTPLERNVESAFARKEHILTMLRADSPDLGNALATAFEDNDSGTIAMVMDQASKQPKLKKYFRDGRGIDGVVYSPEDIAFYENEIKTSDMSAVQKRKLVLNLRKNGTIPQGQPDGRQQQKQSKTRDKSRPLY